MQAQRARIMGLQDAVEQLAAIEKPFLNWAGNSLLHYEGLGGQVQMIYMDPPYGVKFGSNFQPFVRKRDVKHNEDEDMTREPEMVKAYDQVSGGLLPDLGVSHNEVDMALQDLANLPACPEIHWSTRSSSADAAARLALAVLPALVDETSDRPALPFSRLLPKMTPQAA